MTLTSDFVFGIGTDYITAPTSVAREVDQKVAKFSKKEEDFW